MLQFRNDPTAFKAFINEHQNRVFSLVLNKVQHIQDAEEITQDVFIAVFTKPEAFRGDSAVSTWLYRIAINKCIDHIRRKQRHRKWGFTGLFSKQEETAEPEEFSHPGIMMENQEKATILF